MKRERLTCNREKFWSKPEGAEFKVLGSRDTSTVMRRKDRRDANTHLLAIGKILRCFWGDDKIMIISLPSQGPLPGEREEWLRG